MFKFLKKKQKRSDWLEGLLLAEQYYEKFNKDELIAMLSIAEFVTNNQEYRSFEFGKGVLEFSLHQKYLESLDK